MAGVRGRAFRMGGGDDAAAQHRIALVKHHALAPGDGPLWGIKTHVQGAVRKGGAGGRGRPPVADAGA